MTSKSSVNINLSRSSRALTQLTIIFAMLFLLSCSMSFDAPWDNKPTEISQKPPTRTATAATQQESQSAPFSSALPVEGDAGRKWNKYMTDDDDIKYFCDEGAVSKSNGKVQVWIKREFPTGASQRAIVTLYEIECSKASFRTLELHVTYADGKTGRSTEATKWVKIFANSNEEYLLGEYCK